MGSFIAQLRAWATWPALLLLTACSTGTRVEQTSVRKDTARPTYYGRVLVLVEPFAPSSFRVRTEKSLAQALEGRGVKVGLATAHITSAITKEDWDALEQVLEVGDGYEALLIFTLDLSVVFRPDAYTASLLDYSDLDAEAVWEASGRVEVDRSALAGEVLDAVAREAPPRIVEAMVKDGLIR